MPRDQTVVCQDPAREVALLFCGDFNSCPEFSVLRLMTSRRLEEGLADFSSGESCRLIVSSQWTWREGRLTADTVPLSPPSRLAP